MNTILKKEKTKNETTNPKDFLQAFLLGSFYSL